MQNNLSRRLHGSFFPCPRRSVHLQAVGSAGDAQLFRFNVTDAERTVYRLAASSEAVRQRWLQALQGAALSDSASRPLKAAGLLLQSPVSGGTRCPNSCDCSSLIIKLKEVNAVPALGPDLPEDLLLSNAWKGTCGYFHLICCSSCRENHLALAPSSDP